LGACLCSGVRDWAQARVAERYVKKMKSSRWIAKLIAGIYRLPDF